MSDKLITQTQYFDLLTRFEKLEMRVNDVQIAMLAGQGEATIRILKLAADIQEHATLINMLTGQFIGQMITKTITKV
jgi:hypothetical protein